MVTMTPSELRARRARLAADRQAAADLAMEQRRSARLEQMKVERDREKIDVRQLGSVAYKTARAASLKRIRDLTGR